MDYKKLYNQIIDNRKKYPLTKEQYTEKHHILPRCLGGDDSSGNLIDLSAREHFVSHYLLMKMQTPNTREWYKLVNAFIMMNATGTRNRYINSRLYEASRKHFATAMSEQQRGERNSQHGSKWICNFELEQNRKIPKSDDIPVGWKAGRVLNFKKKKQKDLKEQQDRQETKLKRKKNQLIKKVYYEELFVLFKAGSYSSIGEFIKDIDFEFSRQILVSNWQTFLGLPTLQWGKRFTSEDAKTIGL